jgi:hypothetical protein
MPRATFAAFLVTYLPTSPDDVALGRCSSYLVVAENAREAGRIATNYRGFEPNLCLEVSAETMIALTSEQPELFTLTD